MCDDKKNGNQYDVFKDDIFSWEEWSADILSDPVEIRAQMDSFAFVGRTIKQMQMIGLSYEHQRYSVVSTAYGQLMHLPEEERWCRSSYHNIDDEIVFNRYTEIDEPFMIEFEDGDVFEIDIPQEEEFRMSMNRIPWDIEHSVNAPNLDAEVLFSNCIGRTIVQVELNPVILNHDSSDFHSFNEPPYEREFISNITLRLDDGTALRFCGVDDFCAISHIDADDEVLTIRYGELKKGLHNWEDLHVDKVTGFDPDSSTVFFNEKGRENAQGECITLFADSCPASNLYISHWDFLLLDWCISLAVGGWFDECGAYHFTTEEWRDILDEADRILAVETYEAMCEMLPAKQGAHDYMTKKLTCGGEGLWRDKKKHKTQIDDVRKWSELVLCDDGIMHVCGY